MKRLKDMPVGIENFKKLRDRGCYFVDKTMMLKELIDDKSDVKLFTRPRRFGKTLNMSMIQYFFEKTSIDHEHAKLFDGLKISKYPEYMEHQGQYPVINVSFKNMKKRSFNLAYEKFKFIMKNEFLRHEEYILSKVNLDVESKERYENIIRLTASESDYSASLQFLSECMEKAYGKKVIILIDEYDVPLEYAYEHDYYDEMMDLIRDLFESALKTNDSMHTGILTGCLRISKESIFTGFNNFEVFSVLSPSFTDSFGFTQDEVNSLLEYHGMSDRADEMKKWYDGYLFDETEIYNPWSIISCVKNLTANPRYGCRQYWSNTSSNSIVKELIQDVNGSTKDMLENLINGETIRSKIYEDMTYGSINTNINYLWSFLLFTGYLKPLSNAIDDVGEDMIYQLIIPNKEVKKIYENTIKNWFENKVQSANRDEFFEAVLNKDADKVNEYLNSWLRSTISFYDERENYYHGFLAGLLTGFEGYDVKSNRESGDGRYDIFVKDRIKPEKAVIFEFKVTDDYNKLESKAEEAVFQIEKNNYETELRGEKYRQVIKYGIAFYRKTCYTELSEYSD